MSVLGGVILLVVIAGIVIALFGWDRYRDYRKTADKRGLHRPRDRPPDARVVRPEHRATGLPPRVSPDGSHPPGTPSCEVPSGYQGGR